MKRIIPARAGFTHGRRHHGWRRMDHPRSRGVYAPYGAYGWGDEGSSPLARGLRGGAQRPATHPGDHPRSRGVYPRKAHRSAPTAGSSPLARGLHLRILGIPTNPYSTRPLPPSLPTRGPFRRVARAPPSFGAPPAADGRDLEDADATRPPRVPEPGSDTIPTCAGEWRRRPARSGSRRSGGSAPPRSRG